MAELNKSDLLTEDEDVASTDTDKNNNDLVSKDSNQNIDDDLQSNKPNKKDEDVQTSSVLGNSNVSLAPADITCKYYFVTP